MIKKNFLMKVTCAYVIRTHDPIQIDEPVYAETGELSVNERSVNRFFPEA